MEANQKISKALENLIRSYQNSSTKKSKYLYLLDDIPKEKIDNHKKNYADIGEDEKVLLLTGHLGKLGSYGTTGIVITDKNLYYRCLYDSFFSSVYARKFIGKVPLNSIKDLKIGEHDSCYGTAYIGHQLVLNGEVLGIVRMGSSFLYDETMINALNDIFQIFKNPEKFSLYSNDNVEIADNITEPTITMENTSATNNNQTKSKSKTKKGCLWSIVGVLLLFIGFVIWAVNEPYGEELIEDSVKLEIAVYNFIIDEMNDPEHGADFLMYVVEDEDSYLYVGGEILDSYISDYNFNYLSTLESLSSFTENDGLDPIYINLYNQLLENYRACKIELEDFDFNEDSKYERGTFIEANTGIKFIYKYNIEKEILEECEAIQSSVDEYLNDKLK